MSTKIIKNALIDRTYHGIRLTLFSLLALMSFQSHAVLQVWHYDEEAGDYVAFTLPIMAMAVSVSKEDWNGS
ncbi:hypothetical protein QWY77_01565 [Thalassotalea ponticola]|uniref:hypothetical protein n=1 Tax=Thalassotalea ponticola TaxID=1523392 RepID=UPI0025B3BA7D|nr:hypothetical protein [Thalassotalea ponticola]MDN3651472.1 hypothetical protein [Thalassotalea ponticola]